MKLNYAPHIGLNSTEDGMFIHHAGPNPIDQIAFIAEQGFAGIEDNFFKTRPLEQQKQIGQAIEQHGLRMGAMVFNMNFEVPSLVANTAESRDILIQEMNTAVKAAKLANASIMTTLSGISDPSLPDEIQTINMVENLRWLGDEAAKHNLRLGVEAITARNWPGIFLNSTRKASQVVAAANHPNVRLIFDVFQAQVEDGDLLRGLEEAWDQIAMIQLADAPSRTEPGSGEINFQNILQLIRDRGFDGLVELEHAHSIEGLAGEKHSLKTWESLDASIR